MIWRRVFFYGLLAFNLLALMYSGSAIFLWLVLFQTAIVILAVLNIVLSFYFLELTQSVPKLSFAKGDKSILTLTVKNRLPFPCAHLTLIYITMERLLDARMGKLSVSLLPFGRDTVTKEMVFPYRGVYHLGFTVLEASDLFGLLTIKLNASSLPRFCQTQVLVYPRIHEIHEKKPLPDTGSTKTKINSDDSCPSQPDRVSENTLIFGLTDTGSAVVDSESAGEKGQVSASKTAADAAQAIPPVIQKTVLVVDCTAHSQIGETAFLHEDCVTECAVALCRYFTANSIPLKLELCGTARDEILGDNPSDFSAMYDKLAAVAFSGKLDLNTALTESVDEDTGRIVVVASKDKYNLADTLAGYTRRGITVILILVLDSPEFDEAIMHLLGDFSIHGINTITLLPGEDFAYRLGAVL